MNPTPSIERILVPHDFSETADHALAYALTLAKKLGARVTLLHVYEVPTLGASEALVASIEYRAALVRAVGEALDGVAARARTAEVEVGTMLREGKDWMEIDAVAKEQKVGVIVMGTRGRGNLARALLGSVADKVIRTAPCPVLTVHLDK